MGEMGKNKLSKHYYDTKQPEAYGGVAGFHRSTKVTSRKIKDWLSHQEVYTLHKPVCWRFQRRLTIIGGIDHQFQADLIDMRTLRKYNDGISYLVTCIDVFSKFAWALPIKTKTGKALVEVVGKIFAQRKPINLQTDKGSEFVNRTFQKFLRDLRSTSGWGMRRFIV
jgi:transposase InsO family protein